MLPSDFHSRYILFCFVSFLPLSCSRALCPLAFCCCFRVSSPFFSHTVTFSHLPSPLFTSSLHLFCSLFSCFRLFPLVGSPNIFIKITNWSFPSRFCWLVVRVHVGVWLVPACHSLDCLGCASAPSLPPCCVVGWLFWLVSVFFSLCALQCSASQSSAF